jgi:hypothetical protein
MKEKSLFKYTATKKSTTREIKYVTIDNNALAEINVLFFIGRLLVYAEANPSIDNKVGGSKSVIIDIPVRAPRVTLSPRSLKEENDIARIIVCMAGRRKRLANEGALEAILKSLRIIPSHGI